MQKKMIVEYSKLFGVDEAVSHFKVARSSLFQWRKVKFDSLSKKEMKKKVFRSGGAKPWLDEEPILQEVQERRALGMKVKRKVFVKIVKENAARQGKADFKCVTGTSQLSARETVASAPRSG